MENETAGECGTKNPLKLVFHRIEGSTDEQFLAFARQSQSLKGFSWLSVAAGRSSISVSPGSDLESVADLHIRVREAVDHVPWKLTTRSNHTLFEGQIPVIDWSSTLLKRVASISLLRNPRDRIREMYDRTIAQLSPEAAKLFHKLTSLKSIPTFEECLLNEKCSDAMQLVKSCQAQTVAFCGMDCMFLSAKRVTEEMLEKAKGNLHRFLLVGIVEDPRATAEMLRRIVPTYFEFLPANFSLEHRHYEYSTSATRVLDEICRYDDALYVEAFNVFSSKAKACNIETSEVPLPVHSKKTFALW